ncbi:lipase family protein [Tersicoccus sp. MR15.9]|uniref:lipase family protein n=1 Tax=Tersicoccus mangrovi TaxID=3121635 RepID=UPI002FE56629
MPATPGVLLRTEPLSLGIRLSLPGLTGPLPGRATRLMYTSTDSNDRPTAVTGTYLEPTAPWLGGGSRPLVTLAAGTLGQGDQCAPSLGLERPLILTSETVSANYEILSAYRLLSRGIAVVFTDYAGLGTTDRLHTYVNRLDSGRAVLDAARAARSLPGTSLTPQSKVATFGYSQGGEASAAALELAPSYAPDLPLVAGYSGAPPADLIRVLKGIDGTILTGAIGWAMNGFAQSSPVVASMLDRNLNAHGKDTLKALSTECLPDASVRQGYTRTSSWTVSGEPISAVLAREPAAAAYVDGQRLGRMAPTVPTRVVTGTRDDAVDHAQARQLAADWCAAGATVDYVPVLQLTSSGGTAVNHLAVALADGLAATAWVTDRFNGKPTSGNCAALPRLG